MSDDIIERAEAALDGRWPGERIVSPARFFGGLVRELISALKAERAENERLRAVIEPLRNFMPRFNEAPMSDVRARLAEALWEKLPKSEVLGPIYVKEMADVLADAALSLPGIAIVDTELLVLVLRHKQVAFGREDEVAAAVIAVAAANAAKRRRGEA